MKPNTYKAHVLQWLEHSNIARQKPIATVVIGDVKAPADAGGGDQSRLILIQAGQFSLQ
ncbi:MAG: hypothetical protein OET41_11920 [Xanthomonadales bacterium]|nr:hypothetical protein [Xanthomonadales bacterium]